jgi:phosphoglycerate dehydrogenase-like enzyme
MTSPRRVLACMSKDEYSFFVDPVMDKWDSSIEMIRTDSSIGVEGMLAALNETKAPVLLTAWSSPTTPDDVKTKAPTLKYLCHACGTLRRIVHRPAIDAGLIVTNWGPSIARTVAENTLVHILCCLRGIAEQQIGLHAERGWPKSPPTLSLYERRVGLHGFGHVARELVKQLAPFDCKLSGFAPYDPDEAFSSRGVKRCKTVEELYANNEIIACVAPLTDETKGCVTEKLLRLIPEPGVFVNTGRGGVVDERGLERVAREGNLRIGLDVFEVEPLPAESPLRGLKNVFMTAHRSGPTTDRRKDSGLYAFQNISAYFAGKALGSIIDGPRYELQT